MSLYRVADRKKCGANTENYGRSMNKPRTHGVSCAMATTAKNATIEDRQPCRGCHTTAAGCKHEPGQVKPGRVFSFPSKAKRHKDRVREYYASHPEDERRRNVQKLGLDSWAEYLESGTFAELLRRAYATTRGECLRCHRPAQTVRFMDYRKGTLLGKILSAVEPVCYHCLDGCDRTTDSAGSTASTRQGSAGNRQGSQRPSTGSPGPSKTGSESNTLFMERSHTYSMTAKTAPGSI